MGENTLISSISLKWTRKNCQLFQKGGLCKRWNSYGVKFRGWRGLHYPFPKCATYGHHLAQQWKFANLSKDTLILLMKNAPWVLLPMNICSYKFNRKSRWKIAHFCAGGFYLGGKLDKWNPNKNNKLFQIKSKTNFSYAFSLNVCLIFFLIVNFNSIYFELSNFCIKINRN